MTSPPYRPRPWPILLNHHDAEIVRAELGELPPGYEEYPPCQPLPDVRPETIERMRRAAEAGTVSSEHRPGH